MGETGIIVRYPGNLDPRAEEFIPQNLLQTLPPQPATGYTLPPYTYPYYPPTAEVLPYPHPHNFHPLPASYAAPPTAAPPQVSVSPTRSLLLSHVPFISESELRRELEVFGHVRGVQTEASRDGIVTVHFYDLRHAETALTAIRRQHMQHQTRLRNHYASLLEAHVECHSAAAEPPLPPPAARGLIAGRAVWAQYVVPACNAVPEGQNQGTIVVFNLDSEVSSENLRRVFEAFGPVKELRDTPTKKNQRFVEFFDTRDAAKALKQMNGKEINGKAVVIEFSRPGGHSRKFFHSTHSKKPLNLTIPHLPPYPFSPSPPPQLQRKYSRRFANDATSRSPPSQSQLPFKKSTFTRGSLNKVANSGSIEEAMASMNVGGEGGNGVEERHSVGPPRRNSNGKQSSESSEGSMKHQQLVRNKHWKGKQAKKHETRFQIREDAIVESSSSIDPRTTVMIKNIPNKYSQKLLLNMLDNHCIHCNEQIGDGDDQPMSSYDFVYLPIDFNNKCNVGYGFVNMTSPEAALRLYKAFHLQHWEVFNSRKICEVTYARVQGLEALKEHFKNSKFPCEMEHYLPVVFSPPRDGRELTEPLPVVGNRHHHTIISMTVPNEVPNSDEMMEGGDRISASASDDVLSSQNGGAQFDDDTSEVGGEVHPCDDSDTQM